MPHSYFFEPAKDYRLVVDSQLVQKSQQKGERDCKIPEGPGWGSEEMV